MNDDEDQSQIRTRTIHDLDRDRHGKSRQPTYPLVSYTDSESRHRHQVDPASLPAILILHDQQSRKSDEGLERLDLQ